MNVIVFGATGPTGQQLVRAALGAGHQVTAFARAPHKLALSHDSLRVVEGDVLDAHAVAGALSGQAGVLVALGGKPFGPQPCAPGTLNIVLGMQQHGVRRLVVLTSLGVGDSRGEAGWAFEHLVSPLLLRAEMRDKERQERVVQSSGLDWTLVRPAFLTNGPRRGHFRAGRHLKHPGRISRADVADFMLAQLRSDEWRGQAVSLSE